MYYVAYGSNMNLEQMAIRCPTAKLIGTGFVYGYKLYFNYHADIVYTGDKNDVVPVVMWQLKASDWKALDRYEGYPAYYIKEVVYVRHNGKKEKCIAYVMNNDEIHYDLPSHSYLKGIARGYRANNIDISYLTNAVELSLLNCMDEPDDFKFE